jgi:catechol 2,3-dioxygenase-like lactoylglutathione lyase family enzyme
MALLDVDTSASSSAKNDISYFGVHHLALNTDDMKMTVDFYVRVLGMRLVHAMRVPPGIGTGAGNRGNPPFEEIRHYFFDMGRDALLAFFEMPKGAMQKGDRNALGNMQHVSFAVSPESQTRIRKRLEANQIPYDGPLEILPGVFSIYIMDPNDIRLEFSCQLSAVERRGRACDRSAGHADQVRSASGASIAVVRSGLAARRNCGLGRLARNCGEHAGLSGHRQAYRAERPLDVLLSDVPEVKATPSLCRPAISRSRPRFPCCSSPAS